MTSDPKPNVVDFNKDAANGDGTGVIAMEILEAIRDHVLQHGANLDRSLLKARLRQRFEQARLLDNQRLDKIIAQGIEKFADNIAYLNSVHAVLPIAGKTRVVTFGELEEFPGRETIVMTQTFGDFASLLNKYRHKYTDEKGEPQEIPLGKFWLGNPNRRQYDGGMAFMPHHAEQVVGNKLNLWRGYGVKPIKPAGTSGAAGCNKFLDFMLKVIVSGNEEHFDYLRKREAFILQKRMRSEIAVALQTKGEGAGKGFYENHMGHLLGTHAMAVNNPKHVIGAFNPHLETLLRLTADEALFVGNHEHRNVLFGLITEPKLTIEPKGFSMYPVDNHLNISILSNADHFVPVSGTARRFLVPTVSADHLQDFAYFRDIEDQLRNDGGYEALLFHLLHEVQLRDFDVRKVPRTVGLNEQAAYGRRGVDGLVEIVCNTGRVPCEHESWPGFTVTTGKESGTGFYHFIDMHKDREISGRGLLVVRQLAKEWGCCTGEQRRERGSGDRTQGIQWPSLAELRKRFEDRFGKQQWTHADANEWSTEEEQTPSAITLTLYLRHETEKGGMLFVKKASVEVWLPKASLTMVALDDKGVFSVTIPAKLAHDRGLAAGDDYEVVDLPF